MPTALPFSDRILESSTLEMHSTVKTAEFDGYRAVLPTSPNSEWDTWSLSFEPFSAADAATFRAFVRAVGSWDIVTWTPFGDSTQKKFRIVPDSVHVSYQADLTRYSLQLRQDF